MDNKSKSYLGENKPENIEITSINFNIEDIQTNIDLSNANDFVNNKKPSIPNINKDWVCTYDTSELSIFIESNNGKQDILDYISQNQGQSIDNLATSALSGIVKTKAADKIEQIAKYKTAYLEGLNILSSYHVPYVRDWYEQNKQVLESLFTMSWFISDSIGEQAVNTSVRAFNQEIKEDQKDEPGTDNRILPIFLKRGPYFHFDERIRGASTWKAFDSEYDGYRILTRTQFDAETDNKKTKQNVDKDKKIVVVNTEDVKKDGSKRTMSHPTYETAGANFADALFRYLQLYKYKGQLEQTAFLEPIGQSRLFGHSILNDTQQIKQIDIKQEFDNVKNIVLKVTTNHKPDLAKKFVPTTLLRLVHLYNKSDCCTLDYFNAKSINNNFKLHFYLKTPIDYNQPTRG